MHAATAPYPAALISQPLIPPSSPTTLLLSLYTTNILHEKKKRTYYWKKHCCLSQTRRIRARFYSQGTTSTTISSSSKLYRDEKETPTLSNFQQKPICWPRHAYHCAASASSVAKMQMPEKKPISIIC